MRKPKKQYLTFIFSLLFCLLFLGITLIFPESFKSKLQSWSSASMDGFGGFYLWLGFFAVVLLIVLAISPLGRKRLGSEKPSYGWFSWIAMLYSTGMGAGLLLRAVQEPVFYYLNPPRETLHVPTEFALQYTFFHWGFTPWAFYGLFGLIIGFQVYVHKKRILGSSILPENLQSSYWAVAIDFLIIICTLLGVVAAVGLGGRQLLEAFFYWTDSQIFLGSNAIFLVLLVCSLATWSAFRGVSRGIRKLSNLNLTLATALLLFVWILGTNQPVIMPMLKSLGIYIVEFIPISLNLGTQKVSKDFLLDWTFFYWAFWLAWAPFTGVFIARISQGRSIRQFIIGVLLVPSLGTFLWFTVFGINAFELIELGKIPEDYFESIYSALFNFLNFFPGSLISNAVSNLLVFTFLLTSVDSAIFVLSMFSDDGKTKPNRRMRLFWGTTIALFTIGVIWVGKESLLESVSQLLILSALPFAFLFLGMVLYFILQLYLEKKHE